MITLKDVAERAGVSTMTVSRALNGKKKDVSPETAKKIKKIAKEMGYIPNSSAKALASHSSKLIAAILMDRENQPNPLVDSYNSSFFGELAREIQKNGYDLMLHFIKDYSEINYCLKSWKLEGCRMSDRCWIQIDSHHNDTFTKLAVKAFPIQCKV